MSRGVSPFPIIESSTQEDTVEEHADKPFSPRDSGFEGAGSSVRFDSRPTSGSNNTVSVLSSHQNEKTEEVGSLVICSVHSFIRSKMYMYSYHRILYSITLISLYSVPATTNIPIQYPCSASERSRHECSCSPAIGQFRPS